MPRTEKRFGVVNQPASTAVEELVPSAATTRNVLINMTARSSATISAAIYSGAFSSDPTGSISVSPGSTISISNATTFPGGVISYAYPFGKSVGTDVFIYQTPNTSGLFSVDSATGSSRYASTGVVSGSNTHYWRNVLAYQINWKPVIAGQGNGPDRINTSYVPVSSTDAIGIFSAGSTSIGSLMFDRIGISHTTGTSISESPYGVGQATIQGTGGVSGEHGGGAYALQDGVGYLLHYGTALLGDTTTGRVAAGIYIFSSSSTAFQKRAYWNTDGSASKLPGYALAYFAVSDYNSTHQVFALSQPSTTTAWSGISATSSTSWPAGYTLPSAAAPAGFRIVSNSGTTEPDVNFLTGTITYPAAPTGVTVPTRSATLMIQVCSLKFSPDNTKLAVAYSRNYSGTGDAASVVVVYTRQSDGSWTHTNSSGPSIRYMPQTQDSMAWSPDGAYISVAAGTSATAAAIPVNTPLYVDRWFVGAGNDTIANNTVSSWTVATSKYPDFSNYASPKLGNSSVVSISSSTSTLLGVTSGNGYFGGAAFVRRGSEPGTFFGAINSALTSVASRAVQGIVMQAAGTVGTSGQTATNYVTTVVSDLLLTAGQTTQVSNIVLGSGDRVYVESSASNSVDISAHGIEST